VNDSLLTDLTVRQYKPYLVVEAKSVDGFLEVLSPIRGVGVKRRHRTLIYRGGVSGFLESHPGCAQKVLLATAGLEGEGRYLG
jgi:hypothetical protein